METGNYIRKNNFTFFKWNGDISPIEVIKTLEPHKKGYLLNGNYVEQNFLDTLVVITAEEALKLYNDYASINLAIVMKNRWPGPIQNEHIVTGLSKNSIEKNKFTEVIFKFQHLHPTADFIGYRCTICGGLHIGKLNREVNTY